MHLQYLRRLALFWLAAGLLAFARNGHAAVAPSANLGVSKTGTPAIVNPGQLLTYSITVSNTGPFSASTNVVVHDFLPAGVLFAYSIPAGKVNPATQSLDLPVGDLAVGASTQVTVVVVPNTPGTVVNVASVTSDTLDPSPGNNMASATNTVSTASLPLAIDCSTNITVTAADPAGAAVFFAVAATGGCSPPANVICMPPSGSTFPVGTTTVFCTASDSCGAETNCSFSVTVNPPQYSPLALVCSSNITVTAPGPGGAPVFFAVTATGGCSPLPNVICMPPSGSTFPVGITTVLCTASDTCGNSTNCSFDVTVNPPNYGPLVLNCSTNISVTAGGTNGAVVFFTVTASGGCNPPPFVMCSPPSGSTFPIGNTTVFCTASDTCGGSTNCSFEVTVSPPVYPPLALSCSTNVLVNATGTNGATVFFTVTATGGCTPPYIICVPPSGSTFPVGITTVNCTAADTCGDSTNCSFTVTVAPPNYPPLVLDCSTNISVAADDTNGTVVFFTVTASGGCSPPPFVVAIPPSGSTFPIGTTTVLCTATDSCGDTTNCSFQVTVSPQAISMFCPGDITTVATDLNGAMVFFPVSATGGCAPLEVEAVPPSGNIFPIGSTTVIVTATDACGNSNTCSFAVIVSEVPGAPVVLYQPQSQIVAPGTDVLLSVSVSGSSPLSYQWRYSGTPLLGATTSSLLLPAVATAYEGVYDVVVSNSVDYFTSDPAILIVQPLFVSVSGSSGPGGVIIPSGTVITNAFYGVEFTAQPAPGYEVNHWYLNGEPVQDGGNTYILDSVAYDLSVSNDFRVASPPATPVLLSLGVQANPPQVVVNVSSDPSELPAIEESPDLTNWIPTTLLSNYNGLAQFTEPILPGYGGSGNRFYRVKTQTAGPTISFMGGSSYDPTAAGALVLPADLASPFFSWLSSDSILGQTGGSDITATLWQVIKDNSGIPQALQFAGQIQDGIIAGTIYLSNTVNQATIVVTRTIQGAQRQVTYTLSLLTSTILADSNRDGVVDDNDNANKSIFTTGPAGWGATVLVNCDDDDGDHVPDNWPGGSINGVNVPADTHVNGAGDLLDIGQVVLKRTGVPLASLPAQFQVRLQITLPRTPQGTPLNEPEYFTNLLGGDAIPPEKRVRMFLPTQVQGTDLALGPADNEILGPTQGATAVFLQNPVGAGQYNYSILAGPGRVLFGIEGIEFAASVDVRVQYYFGALQLCSDRVRVKTSPFLLMANNNTVTRTIVSSISVPGPDDNSAFTAAFDAADNVPTTIIPAATANNDVWAQDEWEIGFTQVPATGGGVKTRTVVLDLPRNRGLGTYAIQNMLSSGVGVFEQIKGTASGNVLTYGGNIECSGPVTVTKAGTVYDYRLGRIIVGDTALTRPDGASLPRTLRNFLFAQGVQDPVVIETGWLGVGHVDEVIGVVPDASGADVRNFRMVIGSATRGAGVINGIAAADNGVHIMNGRGTPWEMTVGQFKGDTRGIRTVNTAIQTRYITPIQTQLQRELNIALVTVPAAYYTPANTDPSASRRNLGGARLRNVNVTIANTPFDVTLWQLIFQADPAGGVRFTVQYQRAFVGDPFTVAAGFGKTGADFNTGVGVIVPTAAWAAPATARAGDVFYWYTAKPANIFEVGAWWPGLQNAQVANNRVLAPDPQGPIIAAADVVRADYEAALAGLGLNFNYPAPDDEFTWYHQSHGEVHCGSNRYSSPYPQAANNWWMQPPPAGP